MSQQQQLHQQLMGRSSTFINPIPHNNLMSSTTNQSVIIDPFSHNPTSPYPSAISLTSSLNSLTPLSQSPQSSSHPSSAFAFDPDLEAELVRRRKLEIRRSASIHSSDALPINISRSSSTRTGSIASSCAESSTSAHAPRLSTQQRSTSPRPNQSLSPHPKLQQQQRRPGGSPLSQVHHPSPLRSASSPALPDETNHHNLTTKQREKQAKIEYDKMKKELILIGRREQQQEYLVVKKKKSWFSSLRNKKESIEIEKKDKIKKNNNEIKKDNQNNKGSTIPDKRNKTFNRIFGTLLNHHHHKQIRNPLPTFDQQPSNITTTTPDHLIAPSSHILLDHSTSTSSATTHTCEDEVVVRKVKNVKQGTGVMVVVVDDT